MCHVRKDRSVYKWRSRGESKREKAEAELLLEIKRIHKKSKETYGVRRIKDKGSSKKRRKRSKA